MSYQGLARQYRPRSFDDLVGQEHVVRSLRGALERNQVHHAFLFTGTRGVGKTTIARILAKCLNCEAGVSAKPCGSCASCQEIDTGRFVDLIEVDAASRTKVDDTRELLDNVQYLPTKARYKVYLIDEVHMLSAHSFNALLKTLEEPPPHVKFLLATTDPQKLPVTVLSRCLQFNLLRIPAPLIAARLGEVLGREGIASESGALRLLARAADGSLRDALSLTDQLLAYGGGKVLEDDARNMLGTVERGQVMTLLSHLANQDSGPLLAYARQLDERALDLAQLLEELAALLVEVAVQQSVPEAEPLDPDSADAIGAMARALAPEDVQLWYQIAILGRRDLTLAPDPLRGFMMTLVRMLAFRPQDEPKHEGGEPLTGSRPKPAVTRAVPGAATWSDILGQLDLQGAARQLANNCRLVAREGGLWRLELDERQRNMLTDAQRDKLAQALQRGYGADQRVEIKVAALDVSADATPAQLAAREQSARRQAAREQLYEEPGLKAFKEVFSARIDDGSLRLQHDE
ncbi:MAG: DNA polymerase III subunit gamma/tau [Steroidobacteraceae bacterium]